MEDKIQLGCRGLQVFRPVRLALVTIDETVDCLRLDPPDPVLIHDPLLTFHGQGAAVKGVFVDMVCQIPGDGGQFRPHLFIPQHIQAPVDQPGRFNIVADGPEVDQGIVFMVKEHLLPAQGGIVHFLREEVQDLTEVLFELVQPADAVEFCIRLKDMQQGVHGPCRHHPVLGKLFIGGRPELPVISFQITSLIPAAGLNDPVQIQGHPQGLRIPARFIVGGQGIDGEGLIIGMLGRIRRLPVTGHRPVHASIFPVQAGILHESESMGCFLQEAFVSQESGRAGEEPCDPAVQNAAFDRLRVDPEIRSHISVITAIHIVPESFPEGNQLLYQMLSRLFDHCSTAFPYIRFHCHGKGPLLLLKRGKCPGAAIFLSYL